MISSSIAWVLYLKYEPEVEKRVRVVVAQSPIPEGAIITDELVKEIDIRESGFNEYMISKLKDCIGTKANRTILEGDYIRSYEIIPRERWFKESDRITVIPMEVEERMANLIKQGSFIDIKVIPKNEKLPKTVLSKVRVDDVIDENGLSVGSSGVNKKAFVKIILDKNDRDNLYWAKENGKMIYELYCEESQKPANIEFKIPEQSRIN